MRLMERRGIFFIISLVLMLPAVIYMIWSLFAHGTLLPLSIDYTGGTIWEVRFQEPVAPADVRQLIVDAGHSDTSVVNVEGENTVQVKMEHISLEEKANLVEALTARFGQFEERRYEDIGASIGAEVSRAAIVAVAVASVLILLFLAWAFRQVPHPFRYGACAVTALVHDVLVVLSFAVIMYLLAGWEIDALFLTAVLTVIGFSVSDSIVVFDRIRENLRRHRNETFTTVADRSIVETASRSLGTQICTLLTLVAILMLGGPTLQKFVAIMIVGFVSGTYSSIFNAAALLVAWEERSFFGKKKSANGGALPPAKAAAA